MKNLLILINICIMMYSCNSNVQVSTDDKNQIFDILTLLENYFHPKENIINLNTRSNKWIYYNGRGTEVSDSDRIALIILNIKKIEENHLASDDYLVMLKKSFDVNNNVNLGMILTNHQFGDQMLRVVPTRRSVDNEYCLEGEWDGDEEYLNMSDLEFASFLKTRIHAISKNRALYTVPYAEASITICNQAERKYYNYNYYFIKGKDGKWLLDDIRIEEDED